MAKQTKVHHENTALVSLLSEHFALHLSRLKFLSLLLMTLLKVQSVNFNKLSQGCCSSSISSSTYRRIQRFFALLHIDKDAVYRFLFLVCPLKNNLTLVIDRTNWQFGKLDINIFMLGICYDGISFPIMWKMLPKRGNSNSIERIDLLQHFIRLFGKDCIAALVADREFIGNQWLSFLEQEHIAYHIRIKDNMWFTKPNGERLKMSWILQGLPIKTVYNHPKMLYLDDVLVYVAAMKLAKGEYLIIVSFKKDNAIENYKNRWQIETMFKAFKTKGFNVEDTQMKDINRIDKLIAIIAMAYVWAYKIGIYIHLNIKAITIKKHKRKAISFFKLGLNFIANALFNCNQNKILIAINVLSCT
jgi:hypothetical protein